ncbi:MAG: hypothetical protein GEU96_14875 [Propionibacteriales bacterium]|nr:hypothetical protein [Propionibacteriales bacterium]
MARPTDWSVLGYDSDPVSGDPTLVAELARRYTKTADAIDKAVEGLNKITSATDGQQSKAITELRAKAEEAGTDISKAETRYREAGSALTTYHPELSEAQRISASAHTRATNASNATQISAPGSEKDSSEPEPGSAEDPEMIAAHKSLNEAIGIRDTAAEAAARAIEDVIGTDGLEDGFWDNFGGFLKKLGDIASMVAMVAGILALVLCWVPVIGQALAAIALVATAISLLCKIGTGAITGNWDVKGMVFDVIALATFGVGRAFTTAGRLGALTARSRALPVARTLSRTQGGRVASLMGGRVTNRMASAMRTQGLQTGTRFSRGVQAYTSAFGESAAAWRTMLTTSPRSWGTASSLNGLMGGSSAIDDLAGLSPRVLDASDNVADLASSATRANNIGLGANTAGPLNDLRELGGHIFSGDSAVGTPDSMGSVPR